MSASFDDHIFGHGQSYSGHALGATGALASIEVLENEVLPGVDEKAEYLASKLHQLKEKYSFVGDVRGLGLMWTMELVKDQESKESFRKFGDKYKSTPVKELSKYMLDELDIYVPGDKFGLWIVPPLVVSYEELDWLIGQLDKALIYFQDVIWKKQISV
ncbi:MAG: aminotransferase class III-fold pyridoxal phosphate-dependent enzyme [Cyanothece sp. SIO1E1]|nr:aminotransferase class III-fold pyridoxal phosphate-dependent enzyme [Cyanothece sp. SIO1E1]